MLKDGTSNAALVPGNTITVDASFQVTKFEIYPGQTNYFFGNCTNANASGNLYYFYTNSSYYQNPPGLYCVETPGFDPGAWGNPYGNLGTYGWTQTIYNPNGYKSAYPSYSDVVITPTPTITSSDPSVIACFGTSCTSQSVGAATLTVTYPSTYAEEYNAWCWGGPGCGYVFSLTSPTGSYYYGPHAIVPATSVAIPVIVGAVANQQPVATISAPVTNPNAMTQGSSFVFTGTGTDPDGTVVAYEWTYGGCGAGGTHLAWGNTYDASALPAGTYTISLRVQDNVGDWSAACDARTLTVNPVVPCSVLTGTSCTSTVNACGFNSGIYQCNGSCNAIPPAVPVNYGNICTSAANSCSMTNTGTILCSGACSASAPSDSSCPSVLPVCGNNICESEENPLTCAKDCKVKYKQF